MPLKPRIPTSGKSERNWKSVDYVCDLYRDPLKWQLVKHTAIFALGVWIAREMSDIDPMALLLHSDQATHYSIKDCKYAKQRQNECGL